MRKFNAILFENVRFWEKSQLYALKTLDLKKKPALYALKTLNFKLTLPSLGYVQCHSLFMEKSFRDEREVFSPDMKKDVFEPQVLRPEPALRSPPLFSLILDRRIVSMARGVVDSFPPKQMTDLD